MAERVCRFHHDTVSVDDLTMTYSGNRLAGVSDSGEGLTALGSMHYPDSGGSYTYDANGNMTSDSQKK